MKSFEVSHFSVDRGGKALLRDVSLSVREDTWWMLIGPNGAGKSTLLKAVSASIPSHGSVHLDGQDMLSMKPAERARKIAFMEQSTRITQPYTVREIVSMGRYAYRSLRRSDPRGETAIQKALSDTGLEELRDRSVLTLSGGEQQRVLLAQVLCQEPELLLLDEPGNNLDLACLRQTFELVDAWRKEPGRAVISVVHDLSLAMRFGTHALLLHHGEAAACGPIREVCCPETLRRVWAMDVQDWMRDLNRVWFEQN